MHYLMLITLTLSPDATSWDARNEVFNELINDPTFCGEGGRFGSPRCDWFVIGGRWSGHLKEATLGEAYAQAISAECPELAGPFYTQEKVESNREKLNEIWKRLGGTGESPFARDSYICFGYEDDGALIDRPIYDAVLAKLEGSFMDDHFCDLDGDPVDESFIGRKWIVVVDYHH